VIHRSVQLACFALTALLSFPNTFLKQIPCVPYIIYPVVFVNSSNNDGGGTMVGNDFAYSHDGGKENAGGGCLLD
jgi:hypothetical protein